MALRLCTANTFPARIYLCTHQQQVSLTVISSPEKLFTASGKSKFKLKTSTGSSRRNQGRTSRVLGCSPGLKQVPSAFAIYLIPKNTQEEGERGVNHNLHPSTPVSSWQQKEQNCFKMSRVVFDFVVLPLRIRKAAALSLIPGGSTMLRLYLLLCWDQFGGETSGKARRLSRWDKRSSKRQQEDSYVMTAFAIIASSSESGVAR
ncbi:hypothetical protein AV530_004677 [Patagioenas fasciata monilis]|uniref:Uncharacterized protein n=1 Tax=Patagioenas fasciata monilis TaxID=372326 RepID=A0A1V4KI26_PATFA|nr:hypothetical protein AV530_004677 [Patagioenas fasciata monilis]